jgi:hypothetical protein
VDVVKIPINWTSQKFVVYFTNFWGDVFYGIIELLVMQIVVPAECMPVVRVRVKIRYPFLASPK